MGKQRKLNKLTLIFDPTPCIIIETKGALIKAQTQNSDYVVTRKISHLRIISKDTVFPKSTSDESDNDFKYSRYDSNDNHNHNTRHYLLRNIQPSC